MNTNKAGDHHFLVEIEGVDSKYIAAVVTMDGKTIQRYKKLRRPSDVNFNRFVFDDMKTFFIELEEDVTAILAKVTQSKEKVVKIDHTIFKRLGNKFDSILQGQVCIHLYSDYMYWECIEDGGREPLTTIELTFDEIEQAIQGGV